MTATDELRRMLDERGVEWRGSPNKTKWHHGGIEYVATNAWPRNDATRTKLVLHAIVTPEQAIAATLGSAICTNDCTNSERTSDEQAIAATLGRGECRLDGYTDAMFRVCSGPECTDFIDYAEVCECSACGASVIVPHEYERVTAGSDELWPKFNYCPSCGRKVLTNG